MRFAGIHEGNILTEHEEHRKLALVVEVADEVWGSGALRVVLVRLKLIYSDNAYRTAAEGNHYDGGAIWV